MWDRIQIKQQGKFALKANYWRSVLCALLITVLSGASAMMSSSNNANHNQETDGNSQAVNEAMDGFNSMSNEDKSALLLILAGLAAVGFIVMLIGLALKIFVFNPLQVGCYGFFRENAGGTPVELGVLKTGFTNYGHTFITLFLRDLFTFLWFCLLIVPGLIKIYSYRMVPFILRDYPELSATEVITASRRMMDGNKWRTFVFDLSYIGWYILGWLTLGLVNILWTEPYRQNANAALYLHLNGEDGYGPQPLSSNLPDATFTYDR